MKKTMKTVMLFLLTGILSVSVFGGCGNKTPDDEISVLLIENVGRVQQKQDTPVTDALAKKFGIKFNFIHAPTHDDVASLLGRLASRNEIPDLVITQSFELNKYQKFFLDYSQYRDKMADMFEFIDEPEVSQQVLLGNGSFMVAPAIHEIQTLVAYMIRTDWLENLGLDIPETFDEFDAVMRAFAKDDPNRDGAATEELGFYPMAPAHWLREYCMNFGVSSDNMLEDGNVVYGPLKPEYKEAIQYMNSLYRDNVLDKEFITGTMETFKERISTGKVGFTRAYYNRVEDTMAWSRIGDPNAQWKIILPPLNEETNKRYEQRHTNRVGSFGISINRRVSDVKKNTLIELVNYLYSEEGRLLTAYGVEGVTYDMVDGKPVFKDIVTDNPNWPDSLTTKTYFGIEPGTHFAMVQNKESFIFQPEAMEGLELYESNSEMFSNLELAPPTMLTLNYEEAERDAATYDWYRISEKEASGAYEFIRGTKSFNEWDKFIAELKTYGLDECMQKIDAAYKRTMQQGK